jgi:predicted hydrocarbon binding protein
MTSDQHRHLVGVPATFLPALRQTLHNALGDQGAQVLQEAGFACGDAAYEAFREWLLDKTGVTQPEDLDAAFLGETLSDFFAQSGWGTLAIEPLGAAALALDAADWVENVRNPSEPESEPVCHFTTGLLAAVLGRIAGSVVAVMEVEPSTQDRTVCRFLVGSPETLQIVFDGMTEGSDYQSLLTATHAG